MRFLRVRTGNERIEPFNLVGQTVGHQKIKRTVCDRGLRAKSFAAQTVKDRICALGFVLVQEYFQNLATHRRQPQPFVRTMRLGSGQTLFDTSCVIMSRKADQSVLVIGSHGRATCHVITF